MAHQNKKYSSIRLVYKRSSTLTKVLVLSAVLLSTVTLLSLRSLILETEAQNAAILSQAAQMEEENAKLEQNINSLGTLEGVIQIAKDILGLEDPDTVVLVPQS